MENKQGSVDWLIKLYQQTGKIDNFDLEVANQMFKEQIMKAVDRGFDEGCKFPEDISLNNAEQYYNETYNK
jgi:hypothetical protein